MMVGRLLSFWDGIFSMAMLNFQGVLFKINQCWKKTHKQSSWIGRTTANSSPKRSSWRSLKYCLLPIQKSLLPLNIKKINKLVILPKNKKRWCHFKITCFSQIESAPSNVAAAPPKIFALGRLQPFRFSLRHLRYRSAGAGRDIQRGPQLAVLRFLLNGIHP